MGQREILAQIKVWKAKEYFVYFKIPNRTDGEKDPLCGGEALQAHTKIKRERGEFCSPRCSSRFAYRVISAVISHPRGLHQADRTLRPLARRRARTLRPLEVAIL